MQEHDGIMQEPIMFDGNILWAISMLAQYLPHFTMFFFLFMYLLGGDFNEYNNDPIM